jgi:hypothetical protein
MNRNDIDEISRAVLMLVCIAATIVFIRSQYELCVEMPEEWFKGFVSGLTVCGSFYWLRLRQRE